MHRGDPRHLDQQNDDKEDNHSFTPLTNDISLAIFMFSFQVSTCIFLKDNE